MSRWPAAVAGATLLFALRTAAMYFGEPFRPGLMALLQLAVVVLIATGCGRLLLQVLGFSGVSDSQKTLIGCTMGLGILSLGVFFLCALHALTGFFLALFLGGLWLLGFTEMRAVVWSLGANRNLLGDRPAATSLIFGFLLLTFWMTWAPPHQYDSLVYHLPLAQAYVRARALVNVPGMVYTHFPQNGEMLFTLALLLKSDLLAQMFMWLSLVLSVWWVFEMGRREAPLSAVLLACLLLCTHTSVMLLSSITYIEPLVMLWTTAALLSFLRWRQVSAADPEQRSWLVLSAIFTGLALGAKYYAGITAAIIGGWLLARAVRRRVASSWRPGAAAPWLDAAWYCLVTAGVFMPWLVKNALMAGNPFFPFFNHFFSAGNGGWNDSVAHGYFSALTEYRHGGSYLSDLVQFPAMLLTDSLHYGRGMDALGGLGWELLFWSMPLAVWACWRNRFLRALLAFCGLYLLAWFSTGVVLRFLTPLAPALSLLAANGLYALWQRLGRLGRAGLGGAVAVIGVTHLMLFLFVEFGVFGLSTVLLGVETRDDYLARRLDYYSCARWSQDHLGKNDRMLIVGDQRGYFVEQDHLASSVHAPNAFVLAANAARDPADLAARLKDGGFTAMLLVPRELARLGSGLGEFTPKGQSNWSGLEPAWARPIFKGPACAVYALNPTITITRH